MGWILAFRIMAIGKLAIWLRIMAFWLLVIRICQLFWQWIRPVGLWIWTWQWIRHLGLWNCQLSQRIGQWHRMNKTTIMPGNIGKGKLLSLFKESFENDLINFHH